MSASNENLKHCKVQSILLSVGSTSIVAFWVHRCTYCLLYVYCYLFLRVSTSTTVGTHICPPPAPASTTV